MSARTEARRRQHFLPHRYARNGVALRVTGGRVDEQRRLPSPDDSVVAIDLSEYRFNTVALGLELDLPSATISELFPPSEREDPPGQLVIVTHCKTTRLRRAQYISLGEPSVQHFEAQLWLARHELAGTVELTAYLCRTMSGEPDDEQEGFGVLPGLRLADSRTWQVHIDSPQIKASDYLDVRYESFGGVGALQFPWPENLYQLDCDGEGPILWLNLDHPDVCAVLNSQGTVGRQARMRDSFFDQIGTAVWTRLFLRAAWAIVEHDDVAFAWQTRVLKAWLPLLFPQARGYRTQRSELRRYLQEGEQDAVLARLEGAMQSVSKSCDT